MNNATHEIDPGNRLHQRDALGQTLTEAEQKIMTAYRARIEAEESHRLRPAAMKQEAKIADQEARIRDMEQLLTRSHDFAGR